VAIAGLASDQTNILVQKHCVSGQLNVGIYLQQTESWCVVTYSFQKHCVSGQLNVGIYLQETESWCVVTYSFHDY